jgi:hypothetical protein
MRPTLSLETNVALRRLVEQGDPLPLDALVNLAEAGCIVDGVRVANHVRFLQIQPTWGDRE